MGLYITESYKAVNGLTKAALILLTASLYLGWYGYCTASWGRVFPEANSDYFVGYGVWKIADNRSPLPDVFVAIHGWLLNWYVAFQTFATLGFISVNLGYILILLLVYVAPCKGNADLGFWNGINCIFGSVCWLVAVVVFGVKFDDTFDTFPYDDPTLQYSFILAVVVVAVELVAGILLLVNGRSNSGSGGTAAANVDSINANA
ncbi:uncharacterized protein [Littorina saxatilis]|uniref:Uncharacterized protein n=1 Tax=Littorina saxatilis TaxID=31220 RepID=A0AAN9AMI8_9CAEN